MEKSEVKQEIKDTGPLHRERMKTFDEAEVAPRAMEFITKAGIYVPCDFHPDRKVAFYNATADRLVKTGPGARFADDAQRRAILGAHAQGSGPQRCAGQGQ